MSVCGSLGTGKGQREHCRASSSQEARVLVSSRVPAHGQNRDPSAQLSDVCLATSQRARVRRGACWRGESPPPALTERPQPPMQLSHFCFHDLSGPLVLVAEKTSTKQTHPLTLAPPPAPLQVRQQQASDDLGRRGWGPRALSASGQEHERTRYRGSRRAGERKETLEPPGGEDRLGGSGLTLRCTNPGPLEQEDLRLWGALGHAHLASGK